MGSVPANPLADLQSAAEASWIRYGDGEDAVEVVDSFGAYEAEYAAIRKGVGILALPQRGTVSVEGTDRQTFLQAMLTNDTSNLSGGRACRAFLLSKQGRIDADMVVCAHEGEQTCLVDLDRPDAARVVEELAKYLFSEDTRLEDASAQCYRIALHGPAAAQLADRVATAPEGRSVAELEPYQCARTEVDGVDCRWFRRDEAGAPGLHLTVPIEGAVTVYHKLIDAVGGITPEVEGGVRRELTGRGIGWAAYNTARIEAGTTLYHVDFGPDSLPHETGALEETVSFTKGCYLGQEIVARMHNLGHPKRTLAGLRCSDESLPMAGTEVLDAAGDTVIGAVTSSTRAPMLGQNAVAFAMMKWGKHRPDTEVRVAADGRHVIAKTAALRFL